MKNKFLGLVIFTILLCPLSVGCSKSEEVSEVSVVENSYTTDEGSVTEDIENTAKEKASSTGSHSYDSYLSDCTLPRDDIKQMYEWYTDRSVIEEDRIADFMKPGENYGTYNKELVFTEKILDRVMSASYEFDANNKLISICYHYAENVSDAEYAQYFVDLYNECNKVYGKSATDNLLGFDQLISDPVAFANSADENTDVQIHWGELKANDEVVVLQYTRTINKSYADVIFMQTSPGYY